MFLGEEQDETNKINDSPVAVVILLNFIISMNKLHKESIIQTCREPSFPCMDRIGKNCIDRYPKYEVKYEQCRYPDVSR